MTNPLVITNKDSNRRLDKFLFQYLNAATHSFIYKMLRKKRIKLNGNRAEGNEILKVGDELKFYIAPETIAGFRKEREVEKSATLTGIVFENDDFLVINKPPGLSSHGGMAGKNDHLLARVLYYLHKNGAYAKDATFTPALCNRLDVNTSGLVVCGKNLHALQQMNALFANGGVRKEYLAVVDGIPSCSSHVLEDFYEKDAAKNNAKVVKHETDMKIITKYSVATVSADKKYSLVKISPITGRSHQIRVHMASIGHPLAGDKKYGGSLLQHKNTQLLHCRKLEIAQLNMTWEAELPKGFENCIQDWFDNAFAIREC